MFITKFCIGSLTERYLKKKKLKVLSYNLKLLILNCTNFQIGIKFLFNLKTFLRTHLNNKIVPLHSNPDRRVLYLILLHNIKQY